MARGMRCSEYMKQTGLSLFSYDHLANTWTVRNPEDQFLEVSIPANSVPITETPFGSMVAYSKALTVALQPSLKVSENAGK